MSLLDPQFITKYPQGPFTGKVEPHPDIARLPPSNDELMKVPPKMNERGFPVPLRLTDKGIATAALNFSKPPLGKGGFSVVHEGVFHGQPVAVKVLTIRNEHERKNFEEELRSLLNPALWHNHVCPLLAYCIEHPAFIFPRLTCTNIGRMVRFPDDVKDSICIGIADGLAALHKAGYVHMDMKPDNVLLLFDDQRRIQKGLVGDLGCVKPCDTPVFPYGTIVFLDPQLKFDQLRHPHPGDDVFSLGVTFLCMWTNRIPNVREEIPILMGLLRQVCPYRYSLVTAMLAADINARPTCASIRDTLKERQAASWASGGYPWSARMPPITQPPFIGEDAAQHAAMNGFQYQPPVNPQQQGGVAPQQQFGGVNERSLVMGPGGQLMFVQPGAQPWNPFGVHQQQPLQVVGQPMVMGQPMMMGQQPQQQMTPQQQQQARGMSLRNEIGMMPYGQQQQLQQMAGGARGNPYYMAPQQQQQLQQQQQMHQQQHQQQMMQQQQLQQQQMLGAGGRFRQ